MATSTRPTILLGLSVRARGPEGRRIQLHEVCYRTLDPRGDRVDWVCPIEGHIVGLQWRPYRDQLQLVALEVWPTQYLRESVRHEDALTLFTRQSVHIPKDGVLRLTFGALDDPM